MNSTLTRRHLLVEGATLGAVALFSAACGKSEPRPLACTDTTALSPTELMIRTSLDYVDVSPQPNRVCLACQQFIPSAPNACGTCKIVKGPINPGGFCKSFIKGG